MHWKEGQMSSENKNKRNARNARTVLGLGKDQIREHRDEAALNERENVAENRAPR